MTKKVDGKIIIVDNVKHARVTAVGPGKHLPNGAIRPTCVKPGDYIVLSHMAPGQIRDFVCNGKRVYYVDDQFIDGVIDESDVLERSPEPEEKRIIDTSDELQAIKIVAN